MLSDRKCLVASRLPLARIGATIVEGALLARTGELSEASTRWREALSALDREGMPVLREILRLRYAELRAGDEGREEEARAIGWMKSAGVKRPDRLVRLLAAP